MLIFHTDVYFVYHKINSRIFQQLKRSSRHGYRAVEWAYKASKRALCPIYISHGKGKGDGRDLPVWKQALR